MKRCVLSCIALCLVGGCSPTRDSSWGNMPYVARTSSTDALPCASEISLGGLLMRC